MLSQQIISEILNLFNEEEFIVFIKRIDKENKLRHDYLNDFVYKEVYRQNSQLFKESFLNANPNLKAAFSLTELTIAYVNAFKNNLDYLDYAINFASERGISINIQTFKDLINKELERKTLELKKQRMIRAMEKADGTFTKKITIEDIDIMDGINFENFLGKLFHAMGYQQEVTKASGDQGADLILEKFGEKTVVQAKRYSGNVSNKAVQEVLAAKEFYKCHKSIVITNSYFTKSAKELACSSSVELWDRDILIKTLNEYIILP